MNVGIKSLSQTNLPTTIGLKKGPVGALVGDLITSHSPLKVPVGLGRLALG